MVQWISGSGTLTGIRCHIVITDTPRFFSSELWARSYGILPHPHARTCSFLPYIPLSSSLSSSSHLLCVPVQNYSSCRLFFTVGHARYELLLHHDDDQGGGNHREQRRGHYDLPLYLHVGP